MKRSSPLRVEQLEDRWVPTVDPLLQSVAPPVVVTTAPSPVIDPILIDPTAPPASPPVSTPPVVGAPPPVGTIPPIPGPIWF